MRECWKVVGVILSFIVQSDKKDCAVFSTLANDVDGPLFYFRWRACGSKQRWTILCLVSLICSVLLTGTYQQILFLLLRSLWLSMDSSTSLFSLPPPVSFLLISWLTYIHQPNISHCPFHYWQKKSLFFYYGLDLLFLSKWMAFASVAHNEQNQR